MTHLAQAPRKAEEIRIPHQNGRRRCTAGKIIFPLFAICCFASAVRGKQANTATATVEGTVFVRGSAGDRSFVAGAKVKLNVLGTLETETDEDGKYVVADVPFGTYTVEAVFPGLEARQTVRVETSEVHVPLELRPVEVTASVVVRPDQVETKDLLPPKQFPRRHYVMLPM